MFIYVLKLEGDNYYVGSTKNVAARLAQHRSGHDGSAWTRLHRVLGLDWSSDAHREARDEDEVTLQYMRDYGIDKVRGGSYVRVDLEPAVVQVIQTQLATRSNGCFRCGRSGHFVAQCYAKTCEDGRPLEERTRSVALSPAAASTSSAVADAAALFSSAFATAVVEAATAAAKQHVATLSEKAAHVSTSPVEESEENVKINGRGRHTTKKRLAERPARHKNEPAAKKQKADAPLRRRVCFRCGREGHFSPDCYARTHKDGRPLE